MQYKAEIRQGGPVGATLESIFTRTSGDLMALAVPATQALAKRHQVTTLFFEQTRRGYRQLDVHLRGAPPGILTIVPRPCEMKEVETA